MVANTADCQSWIVGSRLIGAALLALAMTTVVRAAESDAERAARLQQMTAEQREVLLSKKKRFDEIKDEAFKDRLRRLHASIEADPNSNELQQTLDRYHAWLGTLSSGQRAELLTLPADKRIERIKELLKQQETQRFQAFVGNLPDADRQAIFKWLGEFVAQHEAEIIALLPRDQRAAIGEATDQDTKQRMLGFQMAIHRQNPKMPVPSREELNRLMERLTPETLAQIEQAPALEQPERVREMVRGAIFSRRIPPVADDELRKFYTSLAADQRERLEGLEREEFTRRLTWMYHADKNGYRSQGGPSGRGFGGGFGPPRGSGPGRPGEGPRGEGRRGERPDDGREGPPGDRRPEGPSTKGPRPPEGPPIPLPPSP
jgi:hypothetical protein